MKSLRYILKWLDCSAFPLRGDETLWRSFFSARRPTADASPAKLRSSLAEPVLARAYTPWNGSLCLKPSLCSQGPSRPATGRQQTRAKGNLGQDHALQGFTEQVESRDKHQQRTLSKCPCCEHTLVALQCLFLLCIILMKPAAIEIRFAKGVKTPTLVSWLNLLYQSILLLPSRCSAVSSGGNPPTPGQVRASIHWGMAEHTFPCIPQPLTLHQTTDDTVNIQLPKHWMGKPESLLDSTSQGLKPQALWCTAGGKEGC